MISVPFFPSIQIFSVFADEVKSLECSVKGPCVLQRGLLGTINCFPVIKFPLLVNF